MEKRERFINWIGVSLSLPQNRLTEMFYFDKKSNLFFTIHIADYFMLNENFEFDNAVTTSYDKKTERKIISWIKRIEDNDGQIINIPQKGLTDITLKKKEAENFLNDLKIDLEKTEIWQADEKVSDGVNLSKNGKRLSKKKMEILEIKK